MLRTKVIASSVSNLTDARYFAAWGVEAMGFDLNSVSVAQVHAFKDWISGPKVIGQFSSGNEPASIEDVAQTLELDMIQLDFLAPVDWSFTKPVIREVIMESSSPSEGVFILKSSNPTFKLDGSAIELIKSFCTKGTCYIDLNIDLEEYEKILQEVNPEGLILRGGDEEKVGFKSYDELDDIMELLEID